MNRLPAGKWQLDPVTRIQRFVPADPESYAMRRQMAAARDLELDRAPRRKGHDGHRRKPCPQCSKAIRLNAERCVDCYRANRRANAVNITPTEREVA